jgi:5'-nucleotidase
VNTYSLLEATWAAVKVHQSLTTSPSFPPTNTSRIDGYTSLLIEEEGGIAKELISEENGVLISTILRQYFMSLKVLGKWKRWGKSMNTRFSEIQTNLQKNHGHGFHEPSPTSPTASSKNNSQKDESEGTTNQRDNNPKTTTEEEEEEEEDPDIDEDEDDGPMYDSRVPIQFSDKQTEIIRRVMKKWWRVAGLKGSPTACDELGGGEFQVNWTKAIAPRLEGRIKEVGPEVKIES